VLDANQVELMEGARPCVRPPDELSPVRVGQAGGAGSKMIERLTGMRDMDDNSYERSKQRMIDKSVDRRVARLGPMSEDEEAALRAEMAAAIDAIRALDDLTWQVDGQAAADRLHSLYQLKPDRPEKANRQRKPGQLGRASEVLLAPGASDVVATILERRQAE
jgi:hypothetical protein